MNNKLSKVSALLICFTFQVGAHNPPKIKETSPLYIKNKQRIGTSDDGGDGSSNQVIKLNISQLIFKNISLQYEYGFHKNMSGALGLSYLVKRDIPGILFQPEADYGYQLPKYYGWAITPEFRFYPGKKEEHQAPHGFYIAPYFRYAKYTLRADYIDTTYNPMNIQPAPKTKYDVKVSYAGFTGGIMIGAQWIIDEHFSFDWWIMGGGTGKAKLSISAVAVDGNMNMSPQQQTNTSNNIRENLGELQKFSEGTVKIETTPNSAKLTISGVPMLSYRAFGFNFGYAF